MVTVLASGARLSVRLGNGDGTFQNPITSLLGSQAPVGLAAGDFNGDGHTDLAASYVGDCASRCFVGLGNGTGAFPANGFSTPNTAFSVAAKDWNGDGFLDLALPGRYAETVTLALGLGNGVFRPALSLSAGEYPVWVSGADFNEDGLQDIVVSNHEGGNMMVYLQTPPAPAIVSISPSSATANGPAFTLTVTGSAFQNGATVRWNGSARPTTFVGSAQLTAAIPASDLAATADLTTASITVVNPNAATSNPKAFTIVSANVGTAQSEIATAEQTVSVTTAPTASGEAGVSAALSNTGSSEPVSVTAATYSSNPTSGTFFDAGGGFVDLQVSGADAGDLIVANFYYPSTVTGATEANLTLLYFTGSAWAEVQSSGGIAPAKDMTDNLDGTVSGGRFAVTFDNTSTPKVTELSGTVFAASIRLSQAMQILINDVKGLVVGGALNSGNGNSLVVKLEAAVQKIGEGNGKAAINQVQAFINETGALIKAKKLSDVQGQALNAAADRIIRHL